MASELFKFQVDTSSSCFLCLDEISNNENTSEGSSFSLQNIFQYLNIELDKIGTLSTNPALLLKKTDVQVSLCSKCGKTFKEISDLYRSMELIKNKLDVSFQDIHERLKTVDVEGSRHSEDITANSCRSHSKLAANIREEILKKCDLKMHNYHPRVNLVIASDSLRRKATKVDQMEASTNQIKSEDDQKGSEVSQHVEDNIELTCQQHSVKEEPEEDDGEYILGDLDNGEVSSQEECNLEQNVQNTSPDCTKVEENKAPGEHENFEEEELKLVEYQDKHSVTNDRRFKIVCEICQKRFNNTKKLSAHRSVAHVRIDRFACDLCDRKFQKTRYLQQHKDAVHFGTSFSCTFCNKNFNYLRNQKRHEKICSQKTKTKREDQE